MPTSWEPELARLLGDLSRVQDELLKMLARKRELLVAADTAGLAALGPQEEQLAAALQDCLRRREQLLTQAAGEGRPSGSLQALAATLSQADRKGVEDDLRAARAQARLLRHHSLTNWVLIQRTLIHLSQVLEIIATGGRLQPTYGGGTPAPAGALVDRAA